MLVLREKHGNKQHLIIIFQAGTAYRDFCCKPFDSFVLELSCWSNVRGMNYYLLVLKPQFLYPLHFMPK